MVTLEHPTGRRHGRRRRRGGVLLLALAALAVDAAAQQDGRRVVSLWTDEAPLRAVLEHLLGAEGGEVRFGDEVAGLVEGRLDGTLDDVLGTLARDHDLVYYRDAEGMWVDRTDRLVVRFVALEAPALERSRELLASVPEGAEGNTVALSGRGVVVSGDRPFVQKTLARLAELEVDGGVGGGDVVDASLRAAAPAVATVGDPAVGAVTDIPGFHVDYADRAEYAPYMQGTTR